MYHNTNIIYKTDDIINNVKIVNFYRSGEGSAQYFYCECLLCNKIFLARQKDIQRNIVTSCGCDKKVRSIVNFNKFSLKDKTYGLLHVEEYSHTDGRNTYWLCKCKCGNYTIVNGVSLTMHKTTSCGCVGMKVRQETSKTHGMYNTRFYSIWCAVIQRTLNPNCPTYNYYGGRGITIYEPWKIFINFKNDLYNSYLDHVSKYGEKNTSIDRIDVNKGYFPNNVRFATNMIQGYNKRDAVKISINNHEYTKLDIFSSLYVVPITKKSFEYRLENNWNIIDIFRIPTADVGVQHGKFIETIHNCENQKCPIKIIDDPNRKQLYCDIYEELKRNNIWKNDT